MTRRDRRIRLIQRFGAPQASQAITSMVAVRGAELFTDDAIEDLARRLVRIEAENKRLRIANRRRLRA